MEMATIAIATLKVAVVKLSTVNIFYLLSFLSGAALMFALTNFSGGNRSNHVYELRMYHVNEGKMEALIARFGDHTDGIFKRHNMKSIGYWVPADAPHSQNLFIYILEHPSRDEAKIDNLSEFFTPHLARGAAPPSRPPPAP